jgi:hypothetical protein
MLFFLPTVPKHHPTNIPAHPHFFPHHVTTHFNSATESFNALKALVKARWKTVDALTNPKE